uniref:RNA helicase n=1 Tax=Ditylenchus dipsaci TaxID=166011 RepID=A0A915DJF9_9BILA
MVVNTVSNGGVRCDRDAAEDRRRERPSTSRSSRNELDWDEIVSNADRDVVNEKLNAVMQKRRDNVEKWRLQRKKIVSKEKPQAAEAQLPSGEFKATFAEGNGQAPASTWSLDKEDDEEEEVPTNGHDKSKETSLPSQKKLILWTPICLKSTIQPSSADSKSVAALQPSKTQGDIMEAEEEPERLPKTLSQGFYKEVPELAKMSKKEVDDYREELDDIKVRGLKCPKPIKNWAQCGVDMKIMNALKKHNYVKPTPIQAQAIPSIMSGRDVIGIAKTGAAKPWHFFCLCSDT